jgi:hypothetical protein
LEQIIHHDVITICIVASSSIVVPADRCWWGLLFGICRRRRWCRRVPSSRCTSTWILCFPMKLSNGVILDETIPDQVRFHRVISVGKKVLQLLHGQIMCSRIILRRCLFTAAINFVTWSRKVGSNLDLLYIHSCLWPWTPCTHKQWKCCI